MSEIKKYNIIVMGAYNPNVSAVVSLFKDIHVKYYIKDETVCDDGAFERFWEEYGAEKAELTEDYRFCFRLHENNQIRSARKVCFCKHPCRQSSEVEGDERKFMGDCERRL